MSRTISLIDDVDGTQYGVEERKFSIGEVNYVIDLHDANWAQLLAAIEPWRSRARVQRRNDSFTLTDQQRKDIRNWAAANGQELKARGRFPHAVVQAYFEHLAQG